MLAWGSFNAKPLRYKAVQGERGSTAGRGALTLSWKESSCMQCSSTSHRYRARFLGACLRAAFGLSGKEGKAH